MTRRIWRLGMALGALVVAWSVGGWAAPAAGTVYVSVARSGRPVTGLTARDFAVLVGGREQPVISAAPASEPLTLILFVNPPPEDISITRTAFHSLLSLIREKNPQARVAIVNSASAPTFYEAGAQGVMLDRQVGALYTDANSGNVVERLPELTSAIEKEPSGHRVILAVTTPGLTHGLQYSPQTAPDLAGTHCELWGIQLAPLGSDIIDRDDAYTKLIVASGGQRATVYGATLLEGRARDMVSLILSQYLVTFQPPDVRGTLAIRVGVRGQSPGTEVFAPNWLVTAPRF